MKKVHLVQIIVMMLLLIGCGTVAENGASIMINEAPVSLGMSHKKVTRTIGDDGFQLYSGHHIKENTDYYDTGLSCSQVEMHWTLKNYQGTCTVFGQEANVIFYFNEAEELHEIYMDGLNGCAEAVFTQLQETYGNGYTTDWIDVVEIREVCRWDLEDNTSILWSQDGMLIITYTSDIEDIDYVVKYRELDWRESVGDVAFVYLDEDNVPELLTCKNGVYHLYTYDGSEVTEIPLPETVTAVSYGPRHNFEKDNVQTYFPFAYIPYIGRIRVHNSNEQERYDYYLKYADGEFVTELISKREEKLWSTYDGAGEITNKEFTSRLSELGYDKLVLCPKLYVDAQYAYEDMGNPHSNEGDGSDAREQLEAFINGEKEAIYKYGAYDNAVTMSYLQFVTEITKQKTTAEYEYVDFDNDGEEELILHGYGDACFFFDVCGDEVYTVLRTGSFWDKAFVAEMEGKNIILRTNMCRYDKDYVDYYEIMEFDPYGCLIDRAELYAIYEGKEYSEEDTFRYRNEAISMETFETILNSIHAIDDTSSFKKASIEAGIDWKTEPELSGYWGDTIDLDAIKENIAGEGTRYYLKRKDGTLTSYKAYSSAMDILGVTRLTATGEEIQMQDIWKEDVDYFDLIKTYLKEDILNQSREGYFAFQLVENYEEIINHMEEQPELWYWYLNAQGVVITFRKEVMRSAELVCVLPYSEWNEHLKEEYLPDTSDLIAQMDVNEEVLLDDGQWVQITDFEHIEARRWDATIETESAELFFGEDYGDCLEAYILNDSASGYYLLISSAGETGWDDGSVLAYSVLDGTITQCGNIPLAGIWYVEGLDNITIGARVEGDEDWNYYYVEEQYELRDGKLSVVNSAR